MYHVKYFSILAVPVPDSIENRVRDAAPTLDQIPKQSVYYIVHVIVMIS